MHLFPLFFVPKVYLDKVQLEFKGLSFEVDCFSSRVINAMGGRRKFIEGNLTELIEEADDYSHFESNMITLIGSWENAYFIDTVFLFNLTDPGILISDKEAEFILTYPGLLEAFLNQKRILGSIYVLDKSVRKLILNESWYLEWVNRAPVNVISGNKVDYVLQDLNSEIVGDLRSFNKRLRGKLQEEDYFTLGTKNLTLYARNVLRKKKCNFTDEFLQVYLCNGTSNSTKVMYLDKAKENFLNSLPKTTKFYYKNRLVEPHRIINWSNAIIE